jgi:hypothetical protein
MKSAMPPAPWMAATAASPRAASRPLARTCAPRLASKAAVARPMPLVAPVTRAVVPVRSVVVMSFLPGELGCLIHNAERKLGCPIHFYRMLAA